MKIDVSQIKDPELATKLWTLGTAIAREKARKAAKENWQPPKPERDPNERYRGHSHNQVEEANWLKKRITNED